MKLKTTYILLFIILLLTSYHSFGQKRKVKKEKVTLASCTLESKNGQIVGVIEFIQKKDRLRIKGDVEGLSPGKHGIHIHNNDSCGKPGKDYNPTGKIHGSPLEAVSHLGDLGNIVSNYKGMAHIEFSTTRISLNGKMSILGKPVVIHRDPDDFLTQPEGNSGKPIACGIIIKSD